MALIPYRLDAQQWRLADEVMQEEASKPFDSRSAVNVVVNRTRKNCFHSAAKTPTFNAVKKRYERHFLGPGSRSLVEKGDTMMDLASRNPLRPAPLKLAEDIKNKCFKDSPSVLHYAEAIKIRYKQRFMKWMEADEMMKFAAQPDDDSGVQQYQIRAVVHYIKQKFFPEDPSTTKDHIEDRYCRRWLGIANSAAEIKVYDEKCIAQGWSTLPQASNSSRTPHQPSKDLKPANMPNAIALGFPPPPSQLPVAVPNEPQPLLPTVPGAEFVNMPPPTMPSQLPLNGEPATPSNPNSHKRARIDSFDSTLAMSTMDRNSYTNFSRPLLQKFEKQLRDSGFFSTSSASETGSLLSRMSRLSIEVKPCMCDHKHVALDSPCAVCRYPEIQPKLCVYIAREYASPQRADVVDKDEMDNGILTGNANVKNR